MYTINTFDGKKMQKDIISQPQLSLYEYLSLAKQLLARVLKKRNAKFLVYAINNEDIIANLANKLMVADMKHDPNKPGSAALATWRFKATVLFLRGLWKSVGKFKELAEKNILSSTVSEVIDDRKYYKYDNNKELVDYYMSYLTEKEQEIINLYYFDGYTYKMLGEKYNITCEGARQRIQKVINKMRDINLNEQK